MKKLKTVITMLVLAGLVVFSDSGFAARGGTQGPPTDGGGGGAPDLGDLVVLYRDAGGVPILTTELCQQPLAAPGDTFTIDGMECVPELVTGSCVIPVDPTTCAVAAGYETYTQEVDFGRTSVVRSPVSVLEQSLGEVVTKLATAQCTTLDPAGRLVNTSKIDGVVVSAAIDSPLENLAIYRQLMLKGYLGADATQIVLPDDNMLNTAARALGAADDKTGKVTVDQVVYTNQIMGLTDENQPYLPKICINVREEVQGTVSLVEKCFLDYSDYGYQRATNFAMLPAPPYIPADHPIDGYFEYLGVLGEGLFEIVQADITSTVFGTDPGFTNGNVGGFTQAADDTREVIEFTHDRPLPLGSETPVPLCDAPDQDTIYDVSLSQESGLQVPRQIVDGSEGREFTVTVANAGPDPASGIVKVTAITGNGDEIDGSPWEFSFDNLVQGLSESWVTLFSINLGERTTIGWTATAIPDCATCDLNMANNTVTATSNVKVTGGGGGGGKR